MERMVEMPVGVVVERRAIDHPWQKWRWLPVAVIPGAPPVVGSWRPLRRGEGWTQFHAATLPLQLHRKETEAYRVNLSNRPPVVYAVLRERQDADPEQPYEAVRVTASPFEAQDYLDTGEETVEGVPMPDELVAWVRAFIDRHHVDEPFRKRRRRQFVEDEPEFGRVPPVAGGRPDRKGGRGLG